jgi:hypothetical protein
MGTANARILQVVRRYGYSQREVADFLDLHYATVSRLANRLCYKKQDLTPAVLCRFTTGLPEIGFLARPEDARGVTGHVFGHHLPCSFRQFAGQRFSLGGMVRFAFLLFRIVIEPLRGKEPPC